MLQVSRPPQRAALRENVCGSRSSSASRIASASSSPTVGSSAATARICVALARGFSSARLSRVTALPSDVIRTDVRTERATGEAVLSAGR